MSSANYDRLRAKKRARLAEREGRAARGPEASVDVLQEAFDNRISVESDGGTKLSRKRAREKLIASRYEYFDARDLIFSEKNDYHITDDDVRGLAAAILESGITVAIVVKGTERGYEVVDGERRCRAHLYLGEHVAEKHYMLPALYFREGEYSEEDVDFARDMLNVGQRALTNSERARAIKRHRDRLVASRAQDPERYEGRLTRDILADEFGVSARTISSDLSIAENLVPEAAEMYDGNELTKAEAVRIAAMDPEEQLAAIAQATGDQRRAQARQKRQRPAADRNSYARKASNALKRALKSEGKVDRMLQAQLQAQLDTIGEGEADANTTMLSAYVRLKQAIEAGADDDHVLSSIAELVSKAKGQ